MFHFLKKKEKEKNEKNEKNEKIESDNPYLAARTEWNYRYNDIIKGKRNWQYLAFGMVLANILLINGLTHVALNAHSIPYIVKVDTQGNAVFNDYLKTDQTQVSPFIVNAFIRRYIENTRAVIADPVAEKHALNYVYGVTKGEALTFLNAYFPTHDPFKRNKNSTVEIEVNPSLQKSPETWQTNWTETERSLTGQVIRQSNYEALITVKQSAVTDEKEININPLGLYVTRLSWSAQI